MAPFGTYVEKQLELRGPREGPPGERTARTSEPTDPQPAHTSATIKPKVCTSIRVNCQLHSILMAAALLGEPGISMHASAIPTTTDSGPPTLRTADDSETRSMGSTRSARTDSEASVYSEPRSACPDTTSQTKTATAPSRERTRKECSEEGCGRRPSFARDGEHPARCASHRLDGDSNVKHRRCVVPCCSKRSRFGLRGTKSEHCTDHRQPGEIDPFRPPCIFPGCQVTPTYSVQGKKPVRCATHKIEGDMNTNRQKCGENNCVGRPCFVNRITGVKHCLVHFADGDTGGLRGMCQARDPGSVVPCRKYATFAAAKGKPQRCKGHRLTDDIDVLNKMCEAEGCGKRPSFAAVGGVAKRCKSHTLGGDVNVNGKRCCVLNCATIVGVNRTRCKEHTA